VLDALEQAIYDRRGADGEDAAAHLCDRAYWICDDAANAARHQAASRSASISRRRGGRGNRSAAA
jgi:hypothetical protein